MSETPQLSIGLPNFGSWLPSDQWHRFVDLGAMADDCGIDRVVLVDHVVMGTNTDAYRWGRFPTGPDAPWPEPLTLLAGMAAVTSRVRLATGILIAPLRGAALLAKTAATLDVLSQGRLELGVGLGWQREEYAAAGLEWEQRGLLLTDTLGACAALWGDSPARYEGPTLSFSEIYCEPKPVQPGGVPLWIAGTLSRANLDRVVRFGTGWIPIMGETVEGIAQGVATIEQALTAAGRDPDQLRVQGSLPLLRNAAGELDLAATIEGAPALIAAGVTALHLPLQAFCSGITHAPAFFAAAAERFRASLDHPPE